MESYSQRNPKWGNKRMAPSQLKLKDFGCTTTCIADLSTYFGDNLNPAQTCDKVKYNNLGFILWASCKFNTFSFWFREFGKNEVNIKNALADPNLAVILQTLNGRHWVVATGWDAVNKIFKIADPIDGARTTMKRYSNNITGAAYFKR